MESDSRLLELNDRYGNLTYLDRLKMLFGEFEPEEILVTTSFGSTSIALIHMISKVAPRHPIHLINTGYLFKETIQYRDQLINEFDLNVVDVQPRERSHEFTSNHKVWEGNPDFCCFINKVEPLNALKKGKKVWVSGLLGFQNENRAGKRIFEESQGLLKFHPIIDMSQEDLNLYRTIYELPAHPLLYKGFGSIGCVQCTKKGVGRAGRWEGKEKTECGLHS
jgi:phosphoadenosine phosphosulfate reductase